VKNWVCAACLAIRHWILSSQQTTSGETQQHGLALIGLCPRSNSVLTHHFLTATNTFLNEWLNDTTVTNSYEAAAKNDITDGLTKIYKSYCICENISDFVGYRFTKPSPLKHSNPLNALPKKWTLELVLRNRTQNPNHAGHKHFSMHWLQHWNPKCQFQEVLISMLNTIRFIRIFY